MGSNGWRRWFDGPGRPRGPRVSGLPESSNGASSFHLRWLFDPSEGPFVAASVDLEVRVPPAVARLYFWALQADFTDGHGRRAGGAHLGLQWHPGHPGATAVNWGGYDATGTVLPGSDSELPSALRNPHTRDYQWSAATPYRLLIDRAPAADQPGASQRQGAVTAWRGSLTDLSTGGCTVVRDLYPPGDRISGLVMWSEVFARCDDPPCVVRWSRAEAVRADGSVARPLGFGVNYQADRDGGCANTDSAADAASGVVQTTGVERRTPQGAVIRSLSSQ